MVNGDKMHPSILKLDAYGTPVEWITYEKAVYYYSKELVAWTYGEDGFIIYGGNNRFTGTRSSLELPSIMAIKGKVHGIQNRRPALTNRALFRRDHNLCAYCATVYRPEDLTRDHIIPVSRKGQDVWTNVVTACGGCNRMKDDRTPEEADMPLVYLPYAPNKAEHLILMNRTIRADQMEFLLTKVNENSRLRDKTFLQRLS